MQEVTGGSRETEKLPQAAAALQNEESRMLTSVSG